MISWQSIMSVFNTKGTLLKWLKTLDQSLQDGVLQSVSVNSVSAGVITLTFNFADGTTITTPQIELPEGERGPQGVPGADGADGTDGTDGRDALVQNRALSSANITSPMAVPMEALNRTAVLGEPIVMFATDTTENKTYMLIGTVTNVGSPDTNPYVFVTYSSKIDITGMTGAEGTQGPKGDPGPQGENGLNYFFYANITNLGKVPVEGDGFTLASSLVNRTPQIGDRFISVFKYENRSFLATCRVDRTNHAVISLIVETTGDPGFSTKIYKHYITDDQDNRVTIFTNSSTEMTEWAASDGAIILSYGKATLSGENGVIIYISRDNDPSVDEYVFVNFGGEIRNGSLASIVSDEVTEV